MKLMIVSSFLTTTLLFSCQSKNADPVQNHKINQQFTDTTLIDSSQKTLDPIVKNLNHQPDILLPDLEGEYESKSFDSLKTACEISVKISMQGTKYRYVLEIADKVFKGKATVSMSDDKKQVYVTFEGIQWEENDGDISQQEDDKESPQLELPVGIGGPYGNKEITIQNYGNAMNHYKKFADCDDKYIRLVKK